MLRLDNVKLLDVNKEPNREAYVGLTPPNEGLAKVLVNKADGRIVEIVGNDQPSGDEVGDVEVERIDCGGRTVMPGLIDSHVHVTASSANLRLPASMPPSLVYCRSVPILEGMLSRGFTTVRDCGGADHGLAAAVAEGSIRGPTVVFCGKALSQTGGHGDFRAAGENALASGPCRCCNNTIGRVCDGITACREAVRDEVRKGASHIKIMASGGVASPTDRLENLQFSEEELRAIVEEASNAGVYCAAHAYTDVAVARAIRCGVRSIEHGNYASRATLRQLAAAGGFLVPTLVTYDRLTKDGVEGGMAPELVAKIGDLVSAGQRTLAAARAEKVDVCYGSDLLGSMHGWQTHGLKLHLAALPEGRVGAAELLASLTATPARMLRMEQNIGHVLPGYVADLLVVDGDVLSDPGGVLTDSEKNVRVIVKNGRVFKNTLVTVKTTDTNANDGGAGGGGGGASGGGGGGEDRPNIKREPSDTRAYAPKFESAEEEGSGGGGGGSRRVKREAEESHVAGGTKRERR